MAIIERLSVQAGGGVVSSSSQCEQKKDVVSIFIGLGGTGTDAIRAIKTQVNERLIPDNAKEYDDPNSNVSVREYKHIKFLSIDTDSRSSQAGQMGFDVLDNTEKMDLSLSGHFGGVINTDHRSDLKWLCDSNGEIAQVIARGEGAGGIRQAGRYLLFDKIDRFEEKVVELVNSAKTGISGNCKVIVHIFAGISGGTGSGTFLDVCYAVRSALKGKITDFAIAGYFFMPDINLSRPGLDEAAKAYIPKNAYSALQELNYCMSIPNNGGTFRQIIKDGTHIDWDCPPVSICHLIGAETEKLAKIAGNVYEYAMHTVTEYVMDFLSDNPNMVFDVYQLFSNQFTRANQSSQKRTQGYNPCMVSLGAACASIPYKEINTYLVSGMFEAYRTTHSDKVVQADADEVINSAWNVTSQPLNTMVEKIYASLLQKLTGDDVYGLQGYSSFDDPDGAGKPWEFLLDEVQSNGMNALEGQYQEELNKHLGNVAANADRLISQTKDQINEDALIYKLDKALEPIVKDINRGPQFAKNVLDHVEGQNIFNLIEGLRARNNAEYQAKVKENSQRYGDLQETKRIFFNREKQSLLDNDKKRYFDFEDCVLAYAQWIELCGGTYSNSPNAKALVGVYGQITKVLDALENQLRERISTFYAPLCDTIRDLTDTFEANYTCLKSKSTTEATGFNSPLISIRDDNVLALLDEQIGELSMPDTFSNFMTDLMAAGYDVWTKTDTRLPKAIQSFFVSGPNAVFANFAGMTVDKFLERKYGLTGQNLEQKIISDFVGDLINASVPLLPLDGNKFNGQQMYQRKVTFPNTSSAISNALSSPNSNVGNEWALIPSSISDRLLFVQIRDGFPLQAYTWCGNNEAKYFTSDISEASHLYEEDGIYEEIKFSDWRKLPVITAPSVMGDTVPDKMKSGKTVSQELFDKAVERGVIKINDPAESQLYDDYCFIYDVSPENQTEIDGLEDELNRIMTGNISAGQKSAKLEAIKTRVEELSAGGYKQLVKTDVKLKCGGGRTDDVKYDVMMKSDFLYFSPVYQIKVREILDRIENNLNSLQNISEILKQKADEISKLQANSKKNFYTAFYTGVVEIKSDGSIVYEHDDDGMMRPYVLAAYGEEMKYEDIPYYQAYVSYLELDQDIQDAIYKTASKKKASDEAKQLAVSLKDQRITDAEINKLRSKAREYFVAEEAEKIERFLVDLKRFEL